MDSRFLKGFSFAIDRGGTFTDVFAKTPSGKSIVMKLLSEDPANYCDAPREGIRRILEKETGVSMPASEAINPLYIKWIRMGTTVATNALLERKGERMALVINEGFKDLLYIGNQSRPQIFDLKIEKPEVLYEEVVEVKERLVLVQEKCEISHPHHGVVSGKSDVKLQVWDKVDHETLKRDLKRVYDKGIRSLAVVLMHSYIYYEHEQEIGELAKNIGFTQVSLSSDVMPMIKMVPRGFTACADAYLTPCIRRYVNGFTAGFQDGLRDVRVLFMQSDGGLTPVQKFTGSRAILSGPAGGVVGYAMTTYNKESGQPVIGFDMGGTSTDVSRYAGHLEHVFETTTAGITIQAPQLDVNTVAAGGGSRLFFRSGIFVVGPESVGAHPGPVCYRKGGDLAVTDANLVLGRLLPQYFPCIFGTNEDQPLDKNASYSKFDMLKNDINEFLVSDGREVMSVEEIAMGFVKVANENMCRPIRALTQAKGYDTSRHVLACFGGAGGQHACAVARSLGMSTVFIHKYAGVLSAYGIALADVVHEAQETCSKFYFQDSFEYIDNKIEELKKICEKELKDQGFEWNDISSEAFLNMRYDGTDCALMCTAMERDNSNGCAHGDFKKSFLERYKTEFGFTIPDRAILVDDIRVRGTARSSIDQTFESVHLTDTPAVENLTQCYFESGYFETKVYLFEKLSYGHIIEGPAIIIDKACTVLVEPYCTASITKSGDIKIEIMKQTDSQRSVSAELDAIQLSIFSHRFMSIAEQMGRVLQRTSISTNIKERLDFSCAMFGPDGGLVANAPHIPVHLGAMQETVQFQMRLLGDNIKEGDVILCNHPSCGGSHLPDLTVITPVFYPGQPRPVFFVANRGHHADIGGITPGSMPPHSKFLAEEGATFKSFKLVQNGVFDEKGVTKKLMEPQMYPGSSGTRNLRDNLSDLKAQVAANKKGIGLITELIDEYSLTVVQAYMSHIQTNAEIAVRDMLKEIASQTHEQTGQSMLSAVDYMDDGTPISLSISIGKSGSAVFDFTGTGPEVYGNCNAPRAIILSAIIYCLRCMVGHDVPLNQGCLKPVQLIIPPGTILSPSETSAVVGGNVLTTQRIVDVIFRAFKACAASQGCMNNTTFGDESCGYYETVAGGAGAGSSWDGKSGVHTHMTNTRITDPEIIEKRYPVVLRRFQLNPGSGGQGLHKGGDGVIRELVFRRSLTLSILSERRAFSPYGLEGGSDGSRGRNLLFYKDGRKVNLGGKASVKVEAGDCFHLETPGGGGFGAKLDNANPNNDETSRRKRRRILDKNKKFPEKGSLHAYRMMQESA